MVAMAWVSRRPTYLLRGPLAEARVRDLAGADGPDGPRYHRVGDIA
jgi:hypothetical protein